MKENKVTYKTAEDKLKKDKVLKNLYKIFMC